MKSKLKLLEMSGIIASAVVVCLAVGWAALSPEPVGPIINEIMIGTDAPSDNDAKQGAASFPFVIGGLADVLIDRWRKRSRKQKIANITMLFLVLILATISYWIRETQYIRPSGDYSRATWCATSSC